MVDVTSVCKNCGQKKPAKSFVMSLEVGKMVCPECAKVLKGVKKPVIKNDYKSSFTHQSSTRTPIRNSVSGVKPSINPVKPVMNTTKQSVPPAKPLTSPTKSVMFSAKQSSPPTKTAVVKPAKPLDYDEDDKELERLSKSKNGLKKGDSYRCPECRYLFDHTATIGKVYNRCPFCNTSM